MKTFIARVTATVVALLLVGFLGFVSWDLFSTYVSPKLTKSMPSEVVEDQHLDDQEIAYVISVLLYRGDIASSPVGAGPLRLTPKMWSNAKTGDPYAPDDLKASTQVLKALTDPAAWDAGDIYLILEKLPHVYQAPK